MKAVVAGKFDEAKKGTLVMQLSERNLRDLLARYEERGEAVLTKGGIGMGGMIVEVVPDSVHYAA